MKVISGRVLPVVIALLIVVFSIPFVSAADNKQVQAGSTVEYTLSIADSQQKITGIHLELYFNNDVLKVKDCNADNMPNTTINANQNNDGRIVVVNPFIDGSRGLECKEKNALVTVTFEVIKEGSAEVQYYIPYMYDYNMVNIHTYTLTEDMTVDGAAVSANAVPVLADVDLLKKNIKNFDAGDFKNTEDGKAVGDVTDNTEPQIEDDPNENKDVFEYSFYVSDAKQALSSFRIVFLYNTKALKLVDIDITGFGKGDTSINYDNDNSGKIVISKAFVDDKPPVFTKKTEVIKLIFNVIGDEDANIRYFITEMNDTDGVPFYDYTLSESTALNGKTVTEDKTPVLAAEAEIDDGNDISFENKADGKGSGVKPGSDDSGNGLIIGVVCGGVIVIAVVMLIVLKSISNKKKDDEE